MEISDMLRVTAPYLRVGMGQTLGLIFSVLWMDVLLVRRKGPWMQIINGCYLILVVNWLMNGVLRAYFGEEAWWIVLYSVMVFAIAPVNMLVFWYTYEGGLLKTTLGSVIADMIATVHVTFSTGIINVLEHRENIFQCAGELRAADILLVILVAGSFFLLLYLFGEYLKRFRMYRIKHRILWIVGLSAYFIVGMLGRSVEVTSENETKLLFMTEGYAGAAIIGIVLFMIFRIYARGVAQNNDYLKAKENLLKAHYITLQQQIHQIETNRERNNEKMQEILQAQVKDQDEALENYLKDLKRQYEDIAAGMYCRDWAVDAMLTNLAAACRKKGIRPDFLFQKYDPGEIREEDILQIIGSLGETAIRQSGSGDVVRLQAEAVKNQLVFRCVFSGTEKISGKHYRELLKRYQGSYQSSLREGVQTVDMVLQREGCTFAVS